METILNKLSKIGKDKLLHFIVGTYIMLIALTVLDFFNVEHNTSVVISSLLVYLISVGKEIYDMYRNDHHTSDINDIVATSLPAIPISIFYLIITA